MAWQENSGGMAMTTTPGSEDKAEAKNGSTEGKGAMILPEDSTRRRSRRDVETTGKKLGYPKVVFFIIGNEFCERFTFYGMRTILSLFLKNSLDLEESTATIIYHLFAMLCYFFPVLGGIIADSWLGKFRTIAYLSMVYAIGNIVVSVASATTLGIPSKELTFLGLVLIAVGTGGIKPCVSSFGGEQFTVPQQAKQLAAFFSVFYFSINAGSLISTFLTPELRTTQCLGMETCYPLAFGVPAVLMIVAIVIFFLGKPGYKITEPKGNVLLDVSLCIGNAVKNKFRSKGEKKAHWLDYADAKYSESLRNDIRALLRILLIFVPLPIFWALYDQQGSRWTFQANNMNGRVGSFVFKPDQMQVVNPVLIMVFLPLFDYCVYPLLYKIHLLRKPLQKIATGGMLAAVAFIVSAILQMQLDPDLPVETSNGFSQIRVFSTLPCNVTLTGGAPGPSPGQIIDPFVLPKNGFWNNTDFKTTGSLKLHLNVKGDCADGTLALELIEAKSRSFHLFLEDATTKSVGMGGPYEDDYNKDAIPKTRFMYRFKDTSKKHTLKLSVGGEEKYSNNSLTGVNALRITKELAPDWYDFHVDGVHIGKEFLDVGGYYNILYDDSSSSQPSGAILTVIPANVISLFWQLPQYIIISVAEIMVSVTGLEFSFTQAPNSMKSVLSSAWLLTDAFGNLIIILIEAVKIFPHQADEIFLFAGIMVAVMLIFIWLAVRYVPVPPPSSDEDDSPSPPSTPSTAPQQEKERF